MSGFTPHLEILPPPQRRLWGELSFVPREFVLYGGTALALHLGHRDSVDFDFFSHRQLDLANLESRIPWLTDATIVQRDKNTLSAIIDRGGPVTVSFFGVPRLPRLAPAHTSPDNGVQVASLIDLAGTKASVVQVRAEAKDYIDIDALIAQGRIGLPLALTAAKELRGPGFNPEITLKALSYFEDGNLALLPDDVKHRLAAAVAAVDLEHLPDLGLDLGDDLSL
jgi:hypothetical protein